MFARHHVGHDNNHKHNDYELTRVRNRIMRPHQAEMSRHGWTHSQTPVSGPVQKNTYWSASGHNGPISDRFQRHYAGTYSFQTPALAAPQHATFYNGDPFKTSSKTSAKNKAAHARILDYYQSDESLPYRVVTQNKDGSSAVSGMRVLARHADFVTALEHADLDTALERGW